MALKTVPFQARDPAHAVVRAYGRGKQVELSLDDSLPMAALEMGLRAYLMHTEGRFKGARVILSLGRRRAAHDDVARLRHVLESEFGLTVTGILSESLVTGRPEAPSIPGDERPSPAPAAAPHPPAQMDTLLVKGTCRSGTVVHNAGNVVVLGDVNPGAEVTAEGDIVVFGRLRGMAHAGLGRDGQGTVVALELGAIKLGIGPYEYTQHSHNGAGHHHGPQMALVKGERVVIEPYSGTSIRKGDTANES